MTYEELLKQLRERTYQGRHGMAFAKSYLSAVDGCLVGGLCPDKIFELASPEDWQKAVKDSEQKLVYHNPAMQVKKYTENVPEGFCLAFDCVVTSVTRDRDGDILETKGATLDERSPLLWQHLPVYPIGKLFKKLTHTSKKLTANNGIADTVLGRDAAQLVKLDALRISHGFKPKKWEPILEKGSDGKDVQTGFKIQEFDILEISLVSVPSNPDAIITAQSQGKLHHPAVKAMAKGLYAARPKTVRSGWQSDGQGNRLGEMTLPVRVHLEGLPEVREQIKSLTHEPAAGHGACGCGKNGQADKPTDQKPAEEAKPAVKTTKSDKGGLHGHIPLMMPPIQGSWEYLCHELEQAAHNHLDDKGVKVEPWDDVLLVATFPDTALLCVCGWNPVPKGCYSVAWEMDGDKPKWTGDPKEVEITTSISERYAAVLATKQAGSALLRQKGHGLPSLLKAAKLSQKNRDRLTDARDFVTQVKDTDGLAKSSKVLLEKADGLLGEVLTDTEAKPDEGGTDGQPKSVGDLGRKLLGSLVLSDSTALDEAKRVYADLGGVLQALDRQKEVAEWERVAAAVGVGG